MSLESSSSPLALPSVADWKPIVAPHEDSSVLKAVWQISNTLIPYAGLWILIHWSLSLTWWLAAPLAMLAGLLLMRIFIVFHDCGHGSYFKSQRANAIVGFAAGLLTFTPFHHWRWQHAIHHGSTGDLDRRGMGDIWTMTVQEYTEATRWTRICYRISRNPFILFLVAPLLQFVIRHRFSSKGSNRRERHSVWWTNLGLLGMAAGFSVVYGFMPYLLIQTIITGTSGAIGIWLFYVQHQFEDAYWKRGSEWDFTAAALEGSSFYKLPAVLRWLSGNIGYHHVHHLSSRIANYNLRRCHESHPIFAKVRTLTLGSSMRSLSCRLWDERQEKLVGFGELKRRRHAGEAA